MSREPFGGVLAALLVAVHAGRGKSQVVNVRGEAHACRAVTGAQPRVMALAHCDDVFDVGVKRHAKLHENDTLNCTGGCYDKLRGRPWALWVRLERGIAENKHND